MKIVHRKNNNRPFIALSSHHVIAIPQESVVIYERHLRSIVDDLEAKIISYKNRCTDNGMKFAIIEESEILNAMQERRQALIDIIRCLVGPFR